MPITTEFIIVAFISAKSLQYLQGRKKISFEVAFFFFLRCSILFCSMRAICIDLVDDVDVILTSNEIGSGSRPFDSHFPIDSLAHYLSS